MCLTIKDFNYSNPNIENYVKIAEENIHTYKVLKTYNHLNYKTKYKDDDIESHGHFQSVKTFKNEHAKAYIGQGIHSYSTLYEAKKNFYGYSHYIIVKCFIPIGTPYILGKYNDIVSLGLFIQPLDKKGIVKLKK